MVKYIDNQRSPNDRIEVDNITLDENSISSQIGNLVLNPASDIDCSNKNLINISNPVRPQDAVTKSYVDSVVVGGDGLSGDVNVNSIATDNLLIIDNSISSTETNGNINIIPTGTGQLVVGKSINTTGNLSVTGFIQASGSIVTNASISASNSIIGTSLTIGNININDSSIISTNSNGNINITPNGIGKLVSGKILNMSGSIIENVGTPLNDTDVATKAYVDSNSGGSGFDTSEQLVITNNTESTSQITGSIVTLGGIGVALDVNCSALLCSDPTNSTSINNGSLRTYGGMAIAKDLRCNGKVYSGGLTVTAYSDPDIDHSPVALFQTLTPTSGDVDSSVCIKSKDTGESNLFLTNTNTEGTEHKTWAMYLEKASGDLRFNYDAYDPLTGAFGIDKISFNTAGNITADSLTINNININDSSIISTNSNGNINITPNGIGNIVAGKKLNMSGYTIENVGIPVNGTDAATKAYVDFIGGSGFDSSEPLVITNNTESVSIDTGSIITDGGIGVAKNIHCGNTVNAGVGQNLRSNFGYAAVGFTPGLFDNIGTFSHYTMNDQFTYALGQHPLGDTYINTAPGRKISFRSGNSEKMSMTGTLLTSTLPINMSSNTIQNVGDPVNNQDVATKSYVDSNSSGSGLLSSHRIVLTADISNLDPIAEVIFIQCPSVNRNLNNVKAGYFDGQRLYIVKDDFGTTLTIKFQNSSTDSEGIAGVFITTHTAADLQIVGYGGWLLVYSASLGRWITLTGT